MRGLDNEISLPRLRILIKQLSLTQRCQEPIKAEAQLKWPQGKSREPSQTLPKHWRSTRIGLKHMKIEAWLFWFWEKSPNRKETSSIAYASNRNSNPIHENESNW